LVHRDSFFGGLAVAPVFGMVAGAAVGFCAGVACCPLARTSLRSGIKAQAAALKRGAAAFASRVSNRTVYLREPSADLAARLRMAARAGVREARRHLVVVREPSRENLAGVEGLAERL
jgi:hypothetical protein